MMQFASRTFAEWRKGWISLGLGRGVEAVTLFVIGAWGRTMS